METLNQYTLIEYIFNYYNKALFQGQLEYHFIGMKKGVIGFLFPENIKGREGSDYESVPDPQGAAWENVEFHTALVHEMLHLWQLSYGNPSRGGYHNAEYAQKSEEVGLAPSSTGQPGGKRTGQKMSHYPAPVFLKEFNNFPFKEIEYLPLPVKEGEAYTGKNDKTKYQCPGCGFISWNKPNVIINCYGCFELMIQQKGKAGKQVLNKGYEREKEAAARTLELLRKEKHRLHKEIRAEIELTEEGQMGNQDFV